MQRCRMWVAGVGLLAGSAVGAGLVVVAGSFGSSPVAATADPSPPFADLAADRQVYDETGASLDADEVAALEARIDEFDATHDASVVVYVRELSAMPEATLEQVEALQQEWVAATGVDEATAVGILVNREPGTVDEARAGIFVGAVFDDGNVPGSEQRRIVDDALIPPLRDGEVSASVSGALDQLDDSIVNGPDRPAFERFSKRAADSWLPWAGVGTAVVGALPVVAMARRRRRVETPQATLPTARPGVLSPAIAAALVTGKAEPSAVAALVLDLARRGALVIEPEPKDGWLGHDRVAVRLVDRSLVADGVESALWSMLDEAATDGHVEGEKLAAVTAGWKPVREAINAELDAAGWRDPGYTRRNAAVLAVAAAAVLLVIFACLVAGASRSLTPLIAVGALGALAIVALAVSGGDSALSTAGQRAAQPWRAYRNGVRRALADDEHAGNLDLDRALADAVAFGLGSKLDEPVERALGDHRTITALARLDATSSTRSFGGWAAFSATLSSHGAGSGSTVSGGGAGGGGGAAGST